MTTHYEKIQALGNRMASNLETMGVSASFSDGGLTLADKILQIQHFTDGLLLWADKDIIQTGDTVNFCALLLDDKKGVSGETIVFYDSNSVPISYDTSGIHTINKNLGKSFMVHYEGDTELQFYDESNTGYSLVYKANKSLEITSSGSSQITWNNVEWVKMVNGVLSDNNGNSFDLSSLVTNVILMLLVGTGSVYFDVVGVGVTDSNGVATVSYTGKGTGKLNIQAKYGIISSEIYELIDALFYNDKDEWYNASSRITVTENTGSTTLLNTSGSNGFYLANYPNTPKSSISQLLDWDSPLIIEFSVIQQNNASFQIYDGTTELTTPISEITETGTILIKFLTNKIEYYADGELIKTDNNTLNTSRIGFRLTNNSTITYKNFKIYSIH